ncbi:hypothetical protein AFL01nite_20190 [Aeromicrobium flavum]|uniref:LysM domain-containing protein n=1 Tax=Aeromicrobium flavum TaxID=416568 RepID=A0A512HW69_9ACTN|nr:LysM domain-containing protein [Aeromicrobium flavum]GEO89692.1 hypothetical protein AFL01nite_20190 [Aeromicrobium flavum]
MWESTLREVLAAALLLWGLWWVLVLLVSVVDRRLAARIAPPVLRALLVAGAVASTATPARAAPPEALDPLHGLHLPERPVTPTAAAPAPRPTATPAHVVVPGDSLWSIARDHSPGADDARIAAEVRRWHATNRDVIGDDPELIHPGQRLDPPGAR